MKNSFKIIRIFLIFISLTTLLSCKSTYFNKSNYSIDYSKNKNWLHLPQYDLKEVDVFYVYPTAWYKEDPNEPNICEIDNKHMIMGSQKAYNSQATAFETFANIYSPYYRQADAKYILSLAEEDRWKIERGIPATDVINAFDYYIKNFNHNKPFILVGHSQGAMILMILLEDYMKNNPQVYKNMISAYIIGYPITKDFLKRNNHLKFANGADDTNVIISYNTQSKTVKPGGNILISDNTALVINPINWKRDETLALASENLGSNMLNSKGEFSKIMNFADAQIDLKQGVLICSSVDENTMNEFSSIFPIGIYHVFDFPFYYYNLRENAQRRATLFLKNNN